LCATGTNAPVAQVSESPFETGCSMVTVTKNTAVSARATFGVSWMKGTIYLRAWDE
jgi:hypothetical protein